MFCRAVIFAALTLWPATSRSQGLTIWPLIAELPVGQKASAIYLDNQSDVPQQLQLRVRRWQSVDNKEQLSEQTAIVVSPPFVTVPARERQLVRLVYLAADKVSAQQTEQSYRVLIDDVSAVSDKPGHQVHIRMRYSLPLFVGRPPQAPTPADTEAYREFWQQQLQLELQPDAGSAPLRIRLTNRSPVHLRMSQVRLMAGDQVLWSAGDGLFGYVLAGSAHSWQVALPHPVTGPALLQFDSYRVPIQLPVTL